MCGRITQYRSIADYLAAIGWNGELPSPPSAAPAAGWNVPPGSTPWLLQRCGDDRAAHIDRVHWGYRPSWSADKCIPMASNARVEKAASGPVFRHLWKSGRAIVPADGWYEWTGEPRHKQPWYIRLRTDAPMWMAAITDVRPGKPLHDGSEFVIVTAAADGGMVDVHDRRPVVFGAEDAQLWLDPDMPAQQAEQLARSMALPAGAFEWYRVGKEVNKVGNNDPHLIEPIAP